MGWQNRLGINKIHGNEYSTHRGSSYNSYLISDKKTVLIDTVWQPFDKEFVENKLIFVEARMLHWPDNMFAYIKEGQVVK